MFLKIILYICVLIIALNDSILFSYTNILKYYNEFILKIIFKRQLKILLLLFFISLLLNTYKMLFSLTQSEAIFNGGKPKEVENGEGFLAIIAYCSVVGIGFCFFSAYLNNDFRRNSFPDMSFEKFKDEPQFELRDWTSFNETCQKETERLKRILSKTEGGKEVIELENIPKTRIGVTLPTLQNNATLEVEEMIHLKNKINQTNGRRAKLKNAATDNLKFQKNEQTI